MRTDQHEAGPAREVRRLAPVSAFTEMDQLARVGRSGWRSVGFGILHHDLVRSDEQWEHRRVGVLLHDQRTLEADGWTRVGTMWFPWVYYARPTGLPAEPE